MIVFRKSAAFLALHPNFRITYVAMVLGGILAHSILYLRTSWARDTTYARLVGARRAVPSSDLRAPTDK
ncbi:hypothetical protein HMPREF9555_02149 [Selenomonas artemidis F0399]|uniref:Uncharacterized protein n=1 Tax=Selenomonas artemidis F0399 TaxID=749551 RepID=E7N554_9FIRM|nr:hypothetical protein HMPREF9555_02149 [Selenomonas artemidis F0399]